MKILFAILLGGLAAATLDILYAFVVYGPLTFHLTPVEVLQSVARGWIGRDAARAGGMDTALLGAATHLGLATIMAAIYVFASLALPMLLKSPLLWGFIYGLILFFVMNYVVVPLSAAHSSHVFAASPGEAMERIQTALAAINFNKPLMLSGTVFTHTFFVGIPIALIASRFLRPTSP